MASIEKFLQQIAKGEGPTAGLIGSAAGLGAVSGLRTFTGPALMGQAAQTQAIPIPGEPFQFLTSPRCANVSLGLATAELIADKLPFTPNRTSALPLIGRGLAGAAVGGAICSCFKRRPFWGAVAGAAGAIGGAYAGFYLRRSLTKSGKLPDLLVALAEDALAIGSAIAILRSVDVPSAEIAELES